MEDEADILARLRDEANRADFAVRRSETELDEVARALERELKAFEADERELERKIDAARRRASGGHSSKP